jgi:hypothetical protein
MNQTRQSWWQNRSNQILVVINSPVSTIFAFSFAKPQLQRDWRFLLHFDH